MARLLSIFSFLLLLSATAFGAGAVGNVPGAAMAADVTDERMKIAAERIGWTLAKAKGAAAKDRDLHISGDNRLYYACKMVAPVGSVPGGLALQTGPDTTPYTTTAPTVDATSAFQLHSRPGASRMLYLDFNGHITPKFVGGWRNVNIVTPAFQLPGTASPTDQLNLNAIRDIWLHVAEDFAAWDIDVTTAVPPPTARGQRCVIGGSVMDWYGVAGVMGVAHLGSFGNLIDGNDDNNFVFIDNNYPTMKPTTSNYEVTILCISHEVGHTLGLNHWGETVSGSGQDYSAGHTVAGHTQVTTACPIMGNSGKVGWPSVCSLNQWSKGDYPFSRALTGSGLQDDVAIISTYATKLNAPGYDDHGDTLPTASVVYGNSVTAGGVIADKTDVDLLKIRPGLGTLNLTAVAQRKYRNYNGNLQIGLSLLDSTGTVLKSSYVTTSMGNTLAYTITSEGTYYIKINGLGYDPSKTAANQVWTNTGITGTVVGTSAGFTNYGSLGRWSLTGSWQPPGNKVPVAVTTGTAPLTYDYTDPSKTVNFTGLLSTDSDGIITKWDWAFNDLYPSSATGALASHRYNAPGVYRPVLTVTDDLGATASATVTVTVTGPTLTNSCSLASISAEFIRVNSVSDAASATIQVQDQYGNPLRSAVVSVSVSGLVTAPAALYRTDILGRVTVSSPNFKRSTRGTVQFNVTGVTLKTHPYVPADNDCANFVTVTR